MYHRKTTLNQDRVAVSTLSQISELAEGPHHYIHGIWSSWNAKPTLDRPKTWASLPQVCYPTQLSIINNYNVTSPVATHNRRQFKYWHLIKCPSGIIQKGLFWFVDFETVGLCLGLGFFCIFCFCVFLVCGGGMFGRGFFRPPQPIHIIKIENGTK